MNSIEIEDYVCVNTYKIIESDCQEHHVGSLYLLLPAGEYPYRRKLMPIDLDINRFNIVFREESFFGDHNEFIKIYGILLQQVITI